jgi:hypothetical protein
MRENKRSRGAHLIAPSPQPDSDTTADAVTLMATEGGDIPAHVWEALQQAGELAAGRLREILASPKFSQFAPTAQARLIELALTRAYGLPIKRSLSVNLSSGDTDAIAASLLGLGDALPERAENGRSVPSETETPDA